MRHGERGLQTEKEDVRQAELQRGMQSWGGLSDRDRDRQRQGGAQRGVLTSLSWHPGLIPSTVVASGVQGTLDTIWFKPAWNTLQTCVGQEG